MQDFYLKFSDEAEAKSVLYRAGIGLDASQELQRRGEEPPLPAPTPEFVARYQNIDVLGVIYNNDAVLDADGNVLTPATPLDGWHVNVRLVDGEDAAVLEPFAVVPTQPRRVWG